MNILCEFFGHRGFHKENNIQGVDKHCEAMDFKQNK